MAVKSWMSDYTAKKLEEIQEELLGEFDFDGLLGKDERDPVLPEEADAVVMDAIVQRASAEGKKVDCLHPHAKGCWMLLARALTDPRQGLFHSSDAKINNGTALFGKLASDLLPAYMSEEPDPSSGDEVEEPDRAEYLEFDLTGLEMFFASIELGKVAGKPDSKKMKLLEVHKATTEELVVLIDLAIATGDLDTYAKAMEILKDVNPSAHRAIECLTGLPTIMVSATSGHGERGGLGVAEFLQGWMSSGTGDIVGGLSGYKYSEKNKWDEYASGKKEGSFLLDIAGPVFKWIAEKIEGAVDKDHNQAEKLITEAREIVNERISDTSDTKKIAELKAAEEKLQDLDLLYKAGEKTPSEARGEVLEIMGLPKTNPEGKSGSAGSGSAAIPTTPLDDPEKKGTGGPGGEELPPDMTPDMPPAISKPPQDPSRPKEGHYLYALFVQDLPDAGPEEKGKTLFGKPVTDSEFYKLDAFLSTVKLSEEAQLAIIAKKAPIDIDKFAGAFLPLPGGAETLEECGAVDPDPDQLGPAVVFGGWDPGVP